MLYHTLDGSGEVVEGFDLSNGTAEAGHDVKRTSEVEVRHVSVVQRDLRIALPSDSQSLLVKIESLDLEGLLEIRKVQPSPTGNI